MTKHAVGIVGVGRMGEAVASALLSDAALAALYLTPRNSGRVARLVAGDTRAKVAEPQAVLRHCDVVVIALGAAAARQILSGLEFERRHQIISLIAETRLAELETLTPAAGQRCRLLALPSVMAGGQTIPVYPRIPAAESLFGALNRLLAVETEEQLIAYWSITALLSSIIMIGEVAAEWLENAGIEAPVAQIYSKALFEDVERALRTGFGSAVRSVSTPGGLNMMMRQRLKDADIAAEIGRGLDEVYDRLKERTGV